MRCPKCGFISFDNVETCLKCKKDIAEVSAAYQGTIFNVATPLYLKFSTQDEDDESQDDGVEDIDSVQEFADPDLEILVEDGEEGEINFSMDGYGNDDSAEADAAIAKEFGAAETADEPAAIADSEAALDLGMFEDGSEEDTFGFDDGDHSDPAGAVGLEIPEELSDISDLSPPDSIGDEEMLSFDDKLPETSTAPAGQRGQVAGEPEEELDFGSLDMNFSFDDDEPEDADVPGPSAPAAAPKKASGRENTGMDDDLDLDLDLGGLSIHDER